MVNYDELLSPENNLTSETNRSISRIAPDFGNFENLNAFALIITLLGIFIIIINM